MNMCDRYLDLVKKTLTYSLWDEPPIPVDVLLSERTGGMRGFTYRYLVRPFLERNKLQLFRTGVRYWPMKAFTMMPIGLLDSLQSCVETALRDGVPGDLIETGVWRGGASMLMKAVLIAEGSEDRRLFVADSFEGLPAPDGSYPDDVGATYHTVPYLSVPLEDVRNNFQKLDLLDDNVVFLKGWFKDTLPTARIEELAVMRLDGDLYESTWQALSALYPKLSTGGFCIIDD